MCLCLTNSNCVRVSHLVPGLAHKDVKRGRREVEKLRTKGRWKMHVGRRKRNKEETRKRKEYISVGMNYSDVSKKQPRYWPCCALVSSILTFFFVCFWFFTWIAIWLNLSCTGYVSWPQNNMNANVSVEIQRRQVVTMNTFNQHIQFWSSWTAAII